MPSWPSEGSSQPVQGCLLTAQCPARLLAQQAWVLLGAGPTALNAQTLQHVDHFSLSQHLSWQTSSSNDFRNWKGWEEEPLSHRGCRDRGRCWPSTHCICPPGLSARGTRAGACSAAPCTPTWSPSHAQAWDPQDCCPESHLWWSLTAAAGVTHRGGHPQHP